MEKLDHYDVVDNIIRITQMKVEKRYHPGYRADRDKLVCAFTRFGFSENFANLGYHFSRFVCE